MTKEQFEELQLNLQRSDMNQKTYLHQIGVSYSTYNYWRKKLQEEACDKSQELAPISFRESSPTLHFCEQLPSGVTLLFPNGLRAHFGSGSESMLNDLLDKSLTSHVLP